MAETHFYRPQDLPQTSSWDRQDPPFFRSGGSYKSPVRPIFSGWAGLEARILRFLDLGTRICHFPRPDPIPDENLSRSGIYSRQPSARSQILVSAGTLLDGLWRAFPHPGWTLSPGTSSRERLFPGPAQTPVRSTSGPLLIPPDTSDTWP